MTDFYNSNPVLSFEVTELDKVPEFAFGVVASAAPCENKFEFHSHVLFAWRYFLNNCYINAIDGWINDGSFVGGLGLGAKLGCSIACDVLGVYIYFHLRELKIKNNECGEEGVYVDIYWSGDILFSHIC